MFVDFDTPSDLLRQDSLEGSREEVGPYSKVREDFGNQTQSSSSIQQHGWPSAEGKTLSGCDDQRPGYASGNNESEQMTFAAVPDGRAIPPENPTDNLQHPCPVLDDLDKYDMDSTPFDFFNHISGVDTSKDSPNIDLTSGLGNSDHPIGNMASHASLSSSGSNPKASTGSAELGCGYASGDQECGLLEFEPVHSGPPVNPISPYSTSMLSSCPMTRSGSGDGFPYASGETETKPFTVNPVPSGPAATPDNPNDSVITLTEVKDNGTDSDEPFDFLAPLLESPGDTELNTNTKNASNNKQIYEISDDEGSDDESAKYC